MNLINGRKLLFIMDHFLCLNIFSKHNGIKMQGRRIVCVYGSVTGKAESIAEQLVDTAKSNRVQVLGEYCRAVSGYRQVQWSIEPS